MFNLSQKQITIIIAAKHKDPVSYYNMLCTHFNDRRYFRFVMDFSDDDVRWFRSYYHNLLENKFMFMEFSEFVPPKVCDPDVSVSCIRSAIKINQCVQRQVRISPDYSWLLK